MSEARWQFVSPMKQLEEIRVLNHHDTTTVEIGLVTSSLCQTKTHGVHERNLSTRVFVGILGPLRSNRQYRIVSVDQLKSPRVVFTNFKNRQSRTACGYYTFCHACKRCKPFCCAEAIDYLYARARWSYHHSHQNQHQLNQYISKFLKKKMFSNTVVSLLSVESHLQ